MPINSLMPLLLRRKPNPYQSLNSYLPRLAGENGYTTREVLRYAGVRPDYLDAWCSVETVGLLSQNLGIAMDRLLPTTIRMFDDAIGEGDEVNFRQSEDEAICPKCVDYARTYWRLDFLTICPRHGTVLIASQDGRTILAENDFELAVQWIFLASLGLQSEWMIPTPKHVTTDMARWLLEMGVQKLVSFISDLEAALGNQYSGWKFGSTPQEKGIAHGIVGRALFGGRSGWTDYLGLISEAPPSEIIVNTPLGGLAELYLILVDWLGSDHHLIRGCERHICNDFLNTDLKRRLTRNQVRLLTEGYTNPGDSSSNIANTNWAAVRNRMELMKTYCPIREAAQREGISEEEVLELSFTGLIYPTQSDEISGEICYENIDDGVFRGSVGNLCLIDDEWGYFRRNKRLIGLPFAARSLGLSIAQFLEAGLSTFGDHHFFQLFGNTSISRTYVTVSSYQYVSEYLEEFGHRRISAIPASFPHSIVRAMFERQFYAMWSEPIYKRGLWIIRTRRQLFNLLSQLVTPSEFATLAEISISASKKAFRAIAAKTFAYGETTYAILPDLIESTVVESISLSNLARFLECETAEILDIVVQQSITHDRFRGDHIPAPDIVTCLRNSLHYHYQYEFACPVAHLENRWSTG